MQDGRKIRHYAGQPVDISGDPYAGVFFDFSDEMWSRGWPEMLKYYGKAAVCLGAAVVVSEVVKAMVAIDPSCQDELVDSCCPGGEVIEGRCYW